MEFLPESERVPDRVSCLCPGGSLAVRSAGLRRTWSGQSIVSEDDVLLGMTGLKAVGRTSAFSILWRRDKSQHKWSINESSFLLKTIVSFIHQGLVLLLHRKNWHQQLCSPAVEDVKEDCNIAESSTKQETVIWEEKKRKKFHNHRPICVNTTSYILLPPPPPPPPPSSPPPHVLSGRS